MEIKNMSIVKEKKCQYWRKAQIIFGLALFMLVAANISVPAQVHPENCPLDGSNISGDIDPDGSPFIVTGSGTTTLSVSLKTFGGDWSPTGPLPDGQNPGGFVNNSLTILSTTNVNVVVGSIPTGKGTITVSANKIDPAQNASFQIKFVTTFGHYIIINVVLECPNITLGCTLSQGYWKNHPDVWAVSGLTLGNRSYTNQQLLSILNTPVRGNGLVSLSYQLIAAKLNAATGANVPTAVSTGISAADTQIGSLLVPPVGNGSLSTNSTRSLTALLDTYNNGLALDGPPHCDE
jgi:hypothetical protein